MTSSFFCSYHLSHQSLLKLLIRKYLNLKWSETNDFKIYMKHFYFNTVWLWKQFPIVWDYRGTSIREYLVQDLKEFSNLILLRNEIYWLFEKPVWIFSSSFQNFNPTVQLFYSLKLKWIIEKRRSIKNLNTPKADAINHLKYDK